LQSSPTQAEGLISYATPEPDPECHGGDRSRCIMRESWLAEQFGRMQPMQRDAWRTVAPDVQ
jgi:hypothetical protein